MRGRVVIRVARRRAPGPHLTGSPLALVLAGMAGGLLAGSLAWSLQQHRHSRALFHPRPFRRLAALGYLRAHPSVDSARLLHDYLRWEPHPLLRRRARAMLRRMEHLLRS